MANRKLQRRRALQLTGVIGTAAIAGCLGNGDEDSDDNTNGNGNDTDGNNSDANGDTNENGTGNGTAPNGDLPSFTEYLSANQEGETFGIYVDIVAVQDQEVLDEDQSPGDDEPLISSDFLIELPMVGVLFYGFLGLELARTGLEGLIQENPDEEFTSSLSETIVVNEDFVLKGDIDTAEIATTMQTVAEDSFQQQEYTEVDTVNGFTLYQPASSTNELPETYAVDGGHIIRGENRSGVERIIETLDGTRARTANEYDDFAWALRTSGQGDVVISGFNPDGLNENQDEEPSDGDDPFEDLGLTMQGLANSATFQTDTIDASAAFVFGEEPDEAARSQIEEEFGSEATDPSYTYDGSKVNITGSYDKSTLSQ